MSFRGARCTCLRPSSACGRAITLQLASPSRCMRSVGCGRMALEQASRSRQSAKRSGLKVQACSGAHPGPGSRRSDGPNIEERRLQMRRYVPQARISRKKRRVRAGSRALSSLLPALADDLARNSCAYRERPAPAAWLPVWLAGRPTAERAGHRGPVWGNACRVDGARGRSRTDTLLRAADFESAASTNSATRARWRSIRAGVATGYCGRPLRRDSPPPGRLDLSPCTMRTCVALISPTTSRPS